MTFLIMPLGAGDDTVPPPPTGTKAIDAPVLASKGLSFLGVTDAIGTASFDTTDPFALFAPNAGGRNQQDNGIADRHSIVTYQGKKCLKTTFRQGQFGYLRYNSLHLGQGYDEFGFRANLYLPASVNEFELLNSSGGEINGKSVFGINCGDSRCYQPGASSSPINFPNGGNDQVNFPDDQWGCCMGINTFYRSNNTFELNWYPHIVGGRQNGTGNNYRQRAWKWSIPTYIEGWQDNTSYYKSGKGQAVPRGEWLRIEVYGKMDTNALNGVLEFYINGTLWGYVYNCDMGGWNGDRRSLTGSNFSQQGSGVGDLWTTGGGWKFHNVICRDMLGGAYDAAHTPRKTASYYAADWAVYAKTDDTPAPTETRDPFLWPGAVTSPFNTPIGTGATYSGEADAKTTRIKLCNSLGFNTTQWGQPVAQSDPSQTRIVTITASQSGGTLVTPLPADAEPSAGAQEPGNPPDSYINIVTHPSQDASGRQFVYHVYETDNTNYTTWPCTLIRCCDVTGNMTAYDALDPQTKQAVGTNYAGARASGLPGITGAIRGWELNDDNEEIRHAITFGCSQLMLSPTEIVWPAAHKDGSASINTGNLAYGQLLAIPQSVDIEALGLNKYAKKVAYAMQRFGVYLSDRSQSTAYRFMLHGEPTVSTAARDGVLSTVDGLRKNSHEVLKLLRVVTNSTQTNPGGPGTRIYATAPDFGTTSTGPDRDPIPFYFTDIVDAELNTQYVSGIKQTQGIDDSTPTSIVGGEVQTSNMPDMSNIIVDWYGGPFVMHNNRYFRIRQTSSASPLTAKTATFTVGNYTAPWTITTRDTSTTAADVPASVIAADPGTWVVAFEDTFSAATLDYAKWGKAGESHPTTGVNWSDLYGTMHGWDPSNVFIRDGQLVLRVTKRTDGTWYGGMVHQSAIANMGWDYFYAEVRLMTPTAVQNAFTAPFWMWPQTPYDFFADQVLEIDVLEQFMVNLPDEGEIGYSKGIAWDASAPNFGANKTYRDTGVAHAGIWHTYGVLKYLDPSNSNEPTIAFFHDGTEYGRTTQSEFGASADENPFARNVMVMMGIHGGTGYGGVDAGNGANWPANAWHGSEVLIDHVRIWQKTS